MRALITVWLLSLAACLTPPAVLPGGKTALVLDDCSLPADAEVVELEAAPGIVLRGVFVPSDDGAPVVVHLLESGGSVTGERFSMRSGDAELNMRMATRRVLWQLADAGYASLMVDYEGVGASDGERSPAHLERDTRAIWGEAVRRAGSADRVVLRGTSIGCLALATLLEDDLAPAGCVLIAPVRPDTVTRRFGSVSFGPVLTFFVAPFYSDVVDLDLAETLADSPAPVLVYASPDDELLPPDDAAPLRAAVERGGGQWVDEDGGGFMLRTLRVAHHARLATGARTLMPGEAEALQRWAPTHPDVPSRVERVLSALSRSSGAARLADDTRRERLSRLVRERRGDDPRVLAALALTENPLADDLQLLEIVRFLDTRWLAGLDLDEMRDRLDLVDPAGALPSRSVRTFAPILKHWRDGGRPLDAQRALTDVVEWSRGVGMPGTTSSPRSLSPPTWTMSFSMDMRTMLWNSVHRDGLDDRDVARQALRVLLKSIGLDERVLIGEHGRPLIEVRMPDGTTRLLDPELMLQPAQP